MATALEDLEVLESAAMVADSMSSATARLWLNLGNS